MTTPFDSASDKVFWHRYDSFYESIFAQLPEPRYVMEFGVAHGSSIRWLSERFPEAQIVGCDILEPRDDWPRSPRIQYVTLDQGKVDELDQCFNSYDEEFDLIIEDGSHLPEHQKNCLSASLPRIRDGGIYILEDLHTSNPMHPTLRRRARKRANCYHLLLNFERILALGGSLPSAVVDALTMRSLFSADEVRSLFARISEIKIYRRGTMPLKCWRCDSMDFKYEELKCECGASLIDPADSISAAITVRNLR